MRRRCHPALAGTLLTFLAASAAAQDTFYNFESPHVTPMASTPDGSRLLVVNTADARLEVFDLTGGTPSLSGTVPVGLDPVSVRAPTDAQAWIVNHVSDTVSIVDLTLMNVVRTLPTADEPTDVVFANDRAFVSCSQANLVQVFTLADLSLPPVDLPIAGEDPRALAVSPEGTAVYAAIFESGNATTILDFTVVSDPAGPYGGQNPPPNAGDAFQPPLNPDLPEAPELALIVRKDPATGLWLDDNGADWGAFVEWDVLDNDLAIIDAQTLTIDYVPGVMTLDMGLTTLPDGRVAIVGTEARNEIRFEPNITGRFVRSTLAVVDPATGLFDRFDLNPHLADAYANGDSTVSQPLRDQSIADPRGIAWRSDGSLGYVTGMGSNNVALIDALGVRIGEIEVGEGPTGVVLDEPQERLYVLNKFDGTISVVDTLTNTVVDEVPFFDPTPAVIRDGRPLLYDARRTSGLGVTACASCHVDARTDGLAWDLGDPSAPTKPFNQDCQTILGGDCEDWHPLKGPMGTQTLQGIIGTEPLHWRGDREDLGAFNPAFETLLGDDGQLTIEEMDAFEAFLDTVQFQPNPNRNVDDSLKTALGNGNPVTGRTLFTTRRLDGGVLLCTDCHALPTGTNGQITPAEPMNSQQSMKIAQLRNLYEKSGFSHTVQDNIRGFGFTHDGSVPSLVEFLENPVFSFSAGATGDQERRNLTAFLLSFPTGTHAGVGTQVTFDGLNNFDPELGALMETLIFASDFDEQVTLIAKARKDGLSRGYVYTGSRTFETDRAGEFAAYDVMRAQAAAGSQVTFTLVPAGTAVRAGVDRDEDGFFDRDEIDHCGDPADGGLLPIDINENGTVDVSDLSLLLSHFGESGDVEHGDGDIDGDGAVGLTDLGLLLSVYGSACG